MNSTNSRYHVLASAAGRILALVPVSTVTLPNGVVVGMRPVARTRQRLAQVELTEEHRALPPHELIETYAVQVDRKSGVARLARRPSRRAPKRK